MASRDTRALVAHLFRRAGFGLRPEELDHFTTLGVQGSVDYLVNFDQVSDPAEQQFPLPDLSYYAQAELAYEQDKTNTDLRKAHSAARGRAAAEIQAWWVNRMLSTARPLQEKMTLFWHGHFATALSKSPAPYMLQQNQLFRSMALGNFNTLLKGVYKDPAMLLWLDGAQNRKGKPNENFSRELMELFTIGVGNFTEKDVQEGARALTGWTFKRFNSDALNGPYVAHLATRQHDDGVKTYLGHTGNLGADDVMNILSSHPQAGVFQARKLFAFFGNDNADAKTIQPFVDTYYSSKYDMKAVVRQILLSDAFYSDQSFQQHFKSPVEYVIGTVRELNSAVSTKQMLNALAGMGQVLFNPTNVGGWPGGVSWINAGPLVDRFNFAGLISARTKDQNGAMTNNLNPQQLVQQSGAHDTAGLIDYLLARFIGIGATPATRAALIGYLGGNGSLTPALIETRVRNVLQLVLSTPEYQLN